MPRKQPRYAQPTLDLGIAEWLDPLPAPWDDLGAETEPEDRPLADPPTCAYCARVLGPSRRFLCEGCGAREAGR